MATLSPAQLAELREAVRRRDRDREVARLLVRALIVECERLTADPRGGDRALLDAARQWLGDEHV